MASLAPPHTAVPQRFERVLQVTATAWSIALPLPQPVPPLPRGVRARVAQRQAAPRDCRRPAVPFSGFFAISY